MIDNLELILPFLKFESEDDFYYLQILQRKKENSHIGSNSKVIKNYYINSKESLINYYPEIKQLCNVFNARASIRLNKRSYEKVAFKAMVNIANTMMNRDYKFLKASYDRACGLGHNDPEKKWILDIDTIDETFNRKLQIDIYNIEPKGNKVLGHFKSKNGSHLITKPFNLDIFSKKYPEIDVHKDNPTNLYIP
jgi:hypothetical protein